MRVRISKPGLLFLIYTFVAFLPGYFKSDVVRYAELVLACVAVYLAIRNHYKMSGFVGFAIACHLYLTVVSLARGTEDFGVSTVLDFVRIIVYVMMVDFMMAKKREGVFTVICGVLLLYTVIDFISLIAFPNGLIVVDLVWNEWYTTQNAVWFIGGKNARWFYYLPVLIILAWKTRLRPSHKKRLLMILYAAMAIGAMVLEQSDTSALVLGIASAGSVFYIFYKPKKKSREPFKLYPIFLAYVVIMILIITDHAFFLKPIVQGLLGKTMTFSSRTNVWAMTFLQIAKKPIFGSGHMDAAAARNIFGSLTYNHAHNQWLQILWNGGICLLLIYIVFFIRMIYRMARLQSRRDEIFIFCVWLGILINMIFEVNFTSLAVWLLLYIIYNYGDILCMENDVLKNTEKRLRRVYKI